MENVVAECWEIIIWDRFGIVHSVWTRLHCISSAMGDVAAWDSPNFAEIRRNSPKLSKHSPEIRPKFDRNSPKSGGIRRNSPEFAETVRTAFTTRRNSPEIRPKFAETFFNSTEIRRIMSMSAGAGMGFRRNSTEIRRNSPKREKHGLRFAEIRPKFDRNVFELDRNSTGIRRNGNWKHAAQRFSPKLAQIVLGQAGNSPKFAEIRTKFVRNSPKVNRGSQPSKVCCRISPNLATTIRRFGEFRS